MRSLRSKYSFPLVRILLLVLAASMALSGCETSSSDSSPPPDPQAQYLDAVRDAQNMTADKVSGNLTALVATNPNLRWENGVPGTRVLVATYISSRTACESYTNGSPGCKVGQECSGYRYNSWVSVVPELKNLLGSSPTLLRVAQALGLPPPASSATLGNTCFLELYVSPADLFRPSPDPEVTDSEADISFPENGSYDATKLYYSDMPYNAERCPYGDGTTCKWTTYRNWFNNRRAYVYSLSTPYPWTGLGYTYDWGTATFPHFGVSEFVINPGQSGVSVFIKSMTWTGQYFAN